MPNRWVEHVKEFARKNNISYGCALSDPNLKKGYIPKGDKRIKAEKLEMAIPDTSVKPKGLVIQPRPPPRPAAKPPTKAQLERDKEAAEKAKLSPIIARRDGFKAEMNQLEDKITRILTDTGIVKGEYTTRDDKLEAVRSIDKFLKSGAETYGQIQYLNKLTTEGADIFPLLKKWRAAEDEYSSIVRNKKDLTPKELRAAKRSEKETYDRRRDGDDFTRSGSEKQYGVWRWGGGAKKKPVKAEPVKLKSGAPKMPTFLDPDTAWNRFAKEYHNPTHGPKVRDRVIERAPNPQTSTRTDTIPVAESKTASTMGAGYGGARGTAADSLKRILNEGGPRPTEKGKRDLMWVAVDKFIMDNRDRFLNPDAALVSDWGNFVAEYADELGVTNSYFLSAQQLLFTDEGDLTPLGAERVDYYLNNDTLIPPPPMELDPAVIGESIPTIPEVTDEDLQEAMADLTRDDDEEGYELPDLEGAGMVRARSSLVQGNPYAMWGGVGGHDEPKTPPWIHGPPRLTPMTETRWNAVREIITPPYSSRPLNQLGNILQTSFGNSRVAMRDALLNYLLDSFGGDELEEDEQELVGEELAKLDAAFGALDEM
jgi:hypothetical protein